jgi:hypothetical protein
MSIELLFTFFFVVFVAYCIDICHDNWLDKRPKP